MKRYLLSFGLLLFTSQPYAQNPSLWVGVSRNSDPLIRRQEAFMDALCRYITYKSVHVTSNWNEPTSKMTADTCDSCRFRILSDIVDEEKETITISIGNGAFIKYWYESESWKMTNEMRTETVLNIIYEDGTARSSHEYRRLDISREEALGTELSSEFTYTCKNVEKNE